MNQEPKTLDQALHAVLIMVQNQIIINGAPKAQIRQVHFADSEPKKDTTKTQMRVTGTLFQQMHR